MVGVFDQRIALTMPIESGSAGVPIFRGIPGEGAQSLSSAYGEQPWLGDAFGSFTGNPTRLPMDTHEMVAMVAPRGLFIMDNPHIANLGPKSGSVAALGGAEVYKALGAGDNITYWSDVAGRQPLRQPARVADPAAAEHQEVPAADRQRTPAPSGSPAARPATWRTGATGDADPHRRHHRTRRRRQSRHHRTRRRSRRPPQLPPPTVAATTPPPPTGGLHGAAYRMVNAWSGASRAR